MRFKLTIICSLPLFLSGCVVSAAYDVATLPVRAAAKSVDILTTSQDESDLKRGRKVREKEERLGKLSRQLEKAQKDCRKGNDDACDAAREIEENMRDLR